MLCLPLSAPPLLMFSLSLFLFLSKINKHWGTWMAHSVKHPTSAQVMNSQFVGSSPASGSVLTAQSLEPASDAVSPSLCLSPVRLFALCLSLSLSQSGKNIKKNTHTQNFKK